MTWPLAADCSKTVVSALRLNLNKRLEGAVRTQRYIMAQRSMAQHALLALSQL